MKVIVLCAGKNRFRGYDTKPRHLYSVNGEVQIFRVIAPFRSADIPIENFCFVVSDKKSFERFFEERKLYPEIVENKDPYGSAVHSLKVGLERLESTGESIVITQDELLEQTAVKKIISQPGELVCHKKENQAPDTAAFKISSDLVKFFTDDIYLSEDFYAKDRDMYNDYFKQRSEFIPDQFPFRIESGSALVFIMIHAILRVEKYFPEKCNFLNEELQYKSGDLDKIYQTDEFKNFKKYGKNLGKVLFFLKQNLNKILKINS